MSKYADQILGEDVDQNDKVVDDEVNDNKVVDVDYQEVVDSLIKSGYKSKVNFNGVIEVYAGADAYLFWVDDGDYSLVGDKMTDDGSSDTFTLLPEVHSADEAAEAVVKYLKTVLHA